MKTFEANGNKLVANLELYNWEELSNQYSIKASSQLEFLFLFLEKFQITKINELKGSYAFAYHNNNQIFLFRDIVGIKPLCYNDKGEYSTYLKDLKNGLELNPRQYIIFENNKLKVFNRNDYYSIEALNDSYEITKEKVLELFILSVKKRLTSKKIGVLFSGGTDSTLMALILQKLGVGFTCYTASIIGGNIKEGVDVYYAKRISNECNFNWKVCELEFKRVEDLTKEIINIIDSRNYTKVCVALPLFTALKQAQKDGIDTMFTGIGSEEVFADYKRSEDVTDINETCIEGLKSLWIRDMYRDYMLANACNIKLRFPFLDDDFVSYSIRINSDFKINKETGVNKVILRDLLLELGLSYDMAMRGKKAAQYGSKSDRVYEKLSKAKGMFKQEYLDKL